MDPISDGSHKLWPFSNPLVENETSYASLALFTSLKKVPLNSKRLAIQPRGSRPRGGRGGLTAGRHCLGAPRPNEPRQGGKRLGADEVGRLKLRACMALLGCVSRYCVTIIFLAADWRKFFLFLCVFRASACVNAYSRYTCTGSALPLHFPSSCLHEWAL